MSAVTGIDEVSILPTQYLAKGLYIAFVCTVDATRLEITIHQNTGTGPGASNLNVNRELTGYISGSYSASGPPFNKGGIEINRGLHTIIWDGRDNQDNIVSAPHTYGIEVKLRWSIFPYTDEDDWSYNTTAGSYISWQP